MYKAAKDSMFSSSFYWDFFLAGRVQVNLWFGGSVLSHFFLWGECARVQGRKWVSLTSIWRKRRRNKIESMVILLVLQLSVQRLQLFYLLYYIPNVSFLPKQKECAQKVTLFEQQQALICNFSRRVPWSRYSVLPFVHRVQGSLRRLNK